GAVVTLVGDVAFQADEVPGCALEYTLHLALVVGLVLVDPVRHAGLRVLGPRAMTSLAQRFVDGLVVSDVHSNLPSLRPYIGPSDNPAPALLRPAARHKTRRADCAAAFVGDDEPDLAPLQTTERCGEALTFRIDSVILSGPD